ncbi:ABC transporter permease subunit [Streptomyces beijiangensis]|uniref:ABC transporter permease subunit n=2 Tax=Streptomyces beijiangensis TaxID=163361 RepID=A0A939F2F3_9ACTN|nr:ABC transporter permease subunit [Streptomyces beijiangensis]
MTALTALIAAGTNPQEVSPDPTALALSGVYFAQLAAVAVAVAVVTSEYHPRLILLTLSASPRRTTVFTAKALTVTAAVLLAALPGVLGALLAGRSAQHGTHQLPLSDGSLQRAVLGTVLYLLLVALLSVGIALAVRHTAAATGTVLALLYGPYLATQLLNMSTHTLHLVQKFSPMTAGLAVQTTTGAGTAPLAPWTGLAVLAAYAAGALAVGWTLLQRRDA